MVDYYRSKIYKLICNTTGKIYIGSTTQKYLALRLSGYRTAYVTHLKSRGKYNKSFEIIKNLNASIELIEEYCCESKKELYIRTQYYINKLDCIN